MAYTETKTPIVYYGGKTAILNHIFPLVPEHEVYTECFAGGAALFWSKRPAKNETLNDELDLVMNFYTTLKLNFKPLKKLIESSLISRSMHTMALNCIRLHKKGLNVDRVQLAWAFWLCTNFAFSNKIGGGYKYSNDLNTQIPKTLKNRKKEFTEALVERIEGCYLENADALYILESRNVVKAFHYLDPPYPGADQGHYHGYTWKQFEDLLFWLQDQCKGKFLLSNYNSDILTEYTNRNGWHKKEITHRIQATNLMNSNGERKMKTEVLIYNYDSQCGTPRLFKDHNH